MYESPSWLHELWVAREVLWQGFLTSVQVSALAILLGTMVGIVAGLVLTYGNVWMRAPFRFYVDLIRGTPVFVLVLACFYMAPALGWQISVSGRCLGADAVLRFPRRRDRAWRVASVAQRADGSEQGDWPDVLSVPRLRVAAPGAAADLPTWVNSSTEIVKASTLLSVIGVAELLLSTQQIIARTFMTLEFYLFAGFLFFVINYGIELLGRHIEKRVALP